MQELYLIRITACYKPWRYSRIFYTTDGALFHFLNELEEAFIPEIDWSGYTAYDPEDEDFVYNILYNSSINPRFPLVLLGETEIYCE